MISHSVSHEEVRSTAQFVREQVGRLEPLIEDVGAREPSQWPRRGTVRHEIGQELWTLAIRIAGADGDPSPAEVKVMFELFEGLFDYPWTAGEEGRAAAIKHMRSGAFRHGSQFDPTSPWMSRLDLVLAESDRRSGGRLALDYGRVLFRVGRLIARTNADITPSEAAEIHNHIPALRRLMEGRPRPEPARSAAEILDWMDGLMSAG